MTVPWELLGDAAIAILAAVVAVRLSLRAFYSQKWWERKAEAYSEIIAALSLLARTAEAHVLYFEGPPDESSRPVSTEQLQRWQRAKERIAEATAIGAFIVSEEVSRHLSTLRAELAAADAKEPDWYAVATAECDATVKAMTAIRICANRELRKGERRR